LEKICLEIDKAIESALPNSGLKAYGLCELITKGKQQQPVTVDKTRKPAQIHDAFLGIFYHRLISGTSAQDPDFSFGVDIVDRVSPRLRTFLAYKVELGENFIFDFMAAIPKRITIAGYKLIQRSTQIDLIADHEAVYNQEYNEGTPYEKHRTTYNIYAIEYNIEYILC